MNSTVPQGRNTAPDIERAHPVALLTSSRHGARWRCACGAEGGGNGDPTLGWVQHVQDMIRKAAAQ